jgi:hypothetical protein
MRIGPVGTEPGAAETFNAAGPWLVTPERGPR